LNVGDSEYYTNGVWTFTLERPAGNTMRIQGKQIVFMLLERDRTGGRLCRKHVEGSVWGKRGAVDRERLLSEVEGGNI